MEYVVVALAVHRRLQKEIQDIHVLKNKGTEDNRVRKLDYPIQLAAKIFNTKDF